MTETLAPAGRIHRGVRSSTGALPVSLEGEFGWSRATTNGAVSLNVMICGPIPPAC